VTKFKDGIKDKATEVSFKKQYVVDAVKLLDFEHTIQRRTLGDGCIAAQRKLIEPKLATWSALLHRVTLRDPTVVGRNYFIMLSVSEPLEVPDVLCPTEATTDVTKVDTVDKQQSVSSKLSVMNDSQGDVKRSPSSVILFGLGDDDGSAY